MGRVGDGMAGDGPVSLRAMLRYRHSFRAWVGVCDGLFVTLIVSGPVAE